MVAVPVPYVAVAGVKAAASVFNSGVGAVLDFLMGTGGAGYPRCKVYDNTGIAITTDTLLTFDSEVYDTDSMHSTTTNTSRIVFTTAGLYEVVFTRAMASATAATSCDVVWRLNAAGVVGGGTAGNRMNFTTGRVVSLSFTRYFNAGDYIEWFLLYAGVATSTKPGEFQTYCEAKWIAVS